MIRATLVAACVFAFASGAGAQEAREFYAGRQLTFVVGTGPGGYDVYARLLARHIVKHLPGRPGAVVVNMPGANGIIGANYVARTAPKDGTQIFIGTQPLALSQAFGAQGIRFNLAEFSWIGNMTGSNSVTFARADAPAKTLAETREHELLLGSTAPSSIQTLYPLLMNRLLGAKFKVVHGYDSGEAINLAMERGEVQGRSGTSWATLKSTQREWLEKKFVNVLVQVGARKEADLPDVPLLVDLAPGPREREIFDIFSSLSAFSRAFMVGPGVPAERVRALREAFEAALRDPELLDDAARQSIEIDPMSGEDVQKVCLALLGADPAALARARELSEP